MCRFYFSDCWETINSYICYPNQKNSNKYKQSGDYGYNDNR